MECRRRTLRIRGRNFEGHVFQEMCKLLEVDKVSTSSYHPRCNDLIERFHRTLNSMLGKVIDVHTEIGMISYLTCWPLLIEPRTMR